MKHYINGQLVTGEGAMLCVTNPGTEQQIETLAGVSPRQAVGALEAAQHAFPAWSALTVMQRGEWIEKLCCALESEKENLCRLMMQETGKPRAGAQPEVDALSSQLRYFYNEAKAVTSEIIPDYRPDVVNQIIKKPIGVVLAHLAWNFPLMNAVYKLGPALATGCTIVMKPAAKTPLATLYLGEILHRLNFPQGVVNIIAGTSAEIAAPLNGSAIPALITMIGSSQSGTEAMRQGATSIKRYSLELGGNAPAIIWKDADVAQAAFKMSYMKFMNAGQVCVTPNRIFVHQDIHADFLAVAQKVAQAQKFGWGDDRDATMGPLLTEQARRRMQALTQDALAKGATLVCGGKIPASMQSGYYFEPTILTGVTPEMRVYQEEIFGPIMAIIPLYDDSDVVALANDTQYGLAAFVYTENLHRAHWLAAQIEAGTVCINEPRFDINLPHGGVKQSGIGKDCSKYSIEEYYCLKRITYKI